MALDKKDKVFMEMTHKLSALSKCKRKQVACMLVSSDRHRVISFGYNGQAKGSSLECSSKEGTCGCVHAEVNAMIKGRQEPGVICYVTDFPCELCTKALINFGVAKIVYVRETNQMLHDNAHALLTEACIAINQCPKEEANG